VTGPLPSRTWLPAGDLHTFATPLRAVDRIEVCAGARGLRFQVFKTVSPDDPYMAGHFPGLTLLPAVFVLEGLRQAVTTLVGADEPLNLVEITSGRWLAPMQGGDEIRLDVTAEQADGGRWLVTADGVRQDGTPVVAAKVVLGDRDAVPADEPLAPADEAPLPAATACGPDYTAILDRLPVRHPMLLVDRVDSFDPGREITTVKAISGSEPCYQSMADNLPLSRYMYPRALILESFGQSSVLLWLSTDSAEGVPVAAAFRSCRFAGEVRPGAVLRHVARIDRLMSNNVFVSGQTWDGDRCVMTVGALIGSSRPRAQVDRRVPAVLRSPGGG
jgi:3-hydroxymyristoyl/3-hydroxydecanoyl-(acyl carrier protein) dehydratase